MARISRGLWPLSSLLASLPAAPQPGFGLKACLMFECYRHRLQISSSATPSRAAPSRVTR